ncbi:alpha/beta hydrolase [Streptomyces sp. NPDC088348]|uniref:alpha/beta hydrolase n=1 Tax=Streptomyces sp. NPDC088348 TaxID=3365853 RepID=UPI0037FEB400
MDPTAADVGVALTAEGGELFDLFRRPQGRSRARPDERTVIESARTGELRVNGQAVGTYGWGDGRRPVLLVHGWESRASRYAKLIAALVERGCSPVSFDAPGHGESGGDSTTLLEYQAIIAELHGEHGEFAAVVGHSFGALAAFLSMRGGVRAHRVVAVSPVPDFSYLFDTFCVAMKLSPELEREVRFRIERDLYPDVRDMWDRFSVLDGIEASPAPLLIVQDENDETVDPERAAGLAGAVGDRARLFTTRRFGHRRILGAPQVVEEIAAFVAATQVRTGADTEVMAG